MDHIGKQMPTVRSFPFREGFTCVSIGDRQQRACIDKTCKLVFKLPDNLYLFSGFSEGLLRVLDENNDHGFLNANGKIAIRPIWRMAEDFSEGLAAVEIRNTPKDRWRRQQLLGLH